MTLQVNFTYRISVRWIITSLNQFVNYVERIALARGKRNFALPFVIKRRRNKKIEIFFRFRKKMRLQASARSFRVASRNVTHTYSKGKNNGDTTQRGKAATNFGFWILDFGLKKKKTYPNHTPMVIVL
jgi:hypothetical protein